MNNNYYQQPQYGSYGAPGFMYPNQPQKRPEYTNPLGAEKIKEMLARGHGIQEKLMITKEDYDKAICTHRFMDGLKIFQLNDEKGTVKCNICSDEFVETMASPEEIAQISEHLYNILSTIKLSWLDVPEKTAVDFFQALAIIRKVPELAKLAMKNYVDHTRGYSVEAQNQANGFNMYNQILGFGGGMGMMPQQAQYQQPPQPYGAQYPYGVQQPQPYGGQAYSPAAVAMQGNAPGVTGFGYHGDDNVQPTMGQPVQSVQNQQPAQGETVTKTLK